MKTTRYFLVAIACIAILVSYASISHPSDLRIAETRFRSIKQRFGADNSFYMVFASDTQYPRSLGSNGEESSDLKSESEARNRNHVASMNKFASHYGRQVKGVIINGDLVEEGHGNELSMFKSMYGNLNARIYPGLGNHDYAKNVNQCALNGCANQMIDYLQNAVKTLNPINFDYKQSDSYSFPNIVTTYSGSLAYSWDINNVHFVQLNYQPFYERQWSDYVAKSGKRQTYEITSSLDWLQNDLAKARNQGRVIIVNFHDPGDAWGSTEDSKHTWTAPDDENLARQNRSSLIDILKNYKVSAVFVGHIHEAIGPNTFDQYALGDIPIFFCGSAVYNRYLWVKFSDDKMTITAINSASGDTAKYSKPVTYSLSSNREEPVPVPPAPGYITFFNRGGYVAKFSLSYTSNGKSNSFTTKNLSAGNKQRYDIPAGATDIHTKGEEFTGFVWKKIFELDFPEAPNACFKVTGTTGSPKYNNDCN